MLEALMKPIDPPLEVKGGSIYIVGTEVSFYDFVHVVKIKGSHEKHLRIKIGDGLFYLAKAFYFFHQETIDSWIAEQEKTLKEKAQKTLENRSHAQKKFNENCEARECPHCGSKELKRTGRSTNYRTFGNTKYLCKNCKRTFVVGALTLAHTTEFKQAVVEAFRSGMSSYAVAQHFGVQKNTVLTWNAKSPQ